MILPVLIAMVAGWSQRHQQKTITYLIEANRLLKAKLGNRRLQRIDTERRRLAALAHPLGRQRLKAVATMATPDTLMRWYKRLIAQGVRRCDLRQARYRGLAKTHLQHVLTAVAMNLMRLLAWWEERPKAQTRHSRFSAVLQATVSSAMAYT